MVQKAADKNLDGYRELGRRAAAAEERAEKAEAELVQARETNKRLNRRCQDAEAALPDYQKITALPPDGDGVRFVDGSLGRALAVTGWNKAEAERDALRERYRWRDVREELPEPGRQALLMTTDRFWNVPDGVPEANVTATGYLSMPYQNDGSVYWAVFGERGMEIDAFTHWRYCDDGPEEG